MWCIEFYFALDYSPVLTFIEIFAGIFMYSLKQLLMI